MSPAPLFSSSSSGSMKSSNSASASGNTANNNQNATSAASASASGHPYQMGWFRFLTGRNSTGSDSSECSNTTTASTDSNSSVISDINGVKENSGDIDIKAYLNQRRLQNNSAMPAPVSSADLFGIDAFNERINKTTMSKKSHTTTTTTTNTTTRTVAISKSIYDNDVIPMDIDVVSTSVSHKYVQLNNVHVISRDRNPLYIPEILDTIFSFLETSLNTGTDPTKPLDFVKVDSIKYTITRPKLHSVVQVCKLWNACASKYLWKNIKVGNFNNCHRLANSVAATGDMQIIQTMRDNGMDYPVVKAPLPLAPSRINHWIYGNLIRSVTLIPPTQSAGMDYETWNIDELVSVLALCCPKLEDLSLSNCTDITDKPLTLLAKNCLNMRKINLNRCDLVTDVSLMAFAQHLKKLELLNISRPLLEARTHLSDQAIRAVVSSNPNLRELRIRNCDKTSDETLIAIAKSAGKNLLALDLSWCATVTDRGICEGIAKHCPNLISLALNGCKLLTDASLFALLSSFPNLQSLSMAHLPAVRDTILSNMAQKLRNLVILSLNGCTGIRDPSVIALAKNCPKLQNLSLFSLEITDASVKEIANNCTDLISLSVSGCQNITDNGAVHLTKLVNLSSLYLNQAKITDKSILYITSKCTRLRALSLNECSLLTDKAAVAIATWTHCLQSLSMNKCGITVVGIKAIVERCFDLRELSVKDCEKAVFRGPKARESVKGSGDMSIYSAVGYQVLQLVCQRRIALLIGPAQ